MVKERISLRKKQAMMTRQTIYEIGLSLVAKKGFYNVTVDDICLEAGVSKGTYYSHFKSKEEIILEQFLKLDQFYSDAGAKEIAKKNTAEEKLRVFNFILLTNVVNNMGVANVKVAYQSQIGAERNYSKVASEERSVFKILKEVIAEGQKKGELRTDMTSDDLTRTVIRTMRGVIFDWCVTNGQFDLVKEGRRMADLVAEGIRRK